MRGSKIPFGLKATSPIRGSKNPFGLKVTLKANV